VFDLQEDYRETITALPEAQTELQKEQRKKANLARWTHDLVEYAKRWSEWRINELALDSSLTSSEESDANRGRNYVRGPFGRTVERGTDRGGVRRIVENPMRLDRLLAFAGSWTGSCIP